MKALRIVLGVFLTLLTFESTSHSQPGALDVTFNPGSGVGQYLYCIRLQSNGQILIGGTFTTVNGITNNQIARLNSDGSVDTTFNVGQGPGAGIDCIATQSDGKVLVGGNFSEVNDLVNYGVARLRPDGSVDIGFQTSTYTGTQINALAIQPDGKVLIGGFIRTAIPTTFPLMRLNTNGTFDAGFVTGTVSNTILNTISDLALLANGQILVAAANTTVNGITRSNVTRLNSDGTVDTNFTVDPMVGSPGHVTCLLGLTNGQVLIAGTFDTINGYTRQGIARLNANGTLDTTFGRPYSPYDPYITKMALQADGKIIVTDQDNPNPHRLNTNGVDDSTFNVGTGVDQGIQAIAVQPDGRILIGGTFTAFNGVNINRIARLNGDTHVSTVNLLNPQIYFGMNLTGIVSNNYRIEFTTNVDVPSLWTPIYNMTLQTNPQFILDPNPESGQRFYRAVSIP